jgi:leucyl/phenylalanyl-tRNA--protein transferase
VRHIPAINPEELLLAYRLGIFPMAESRQAKPVLWVRPHERGIIPIETFHVPKRLARTVRRDRFQVRVDTQFTEVIRGCAESKPGRRETWINDAIIEVFEILFDRKLAHSVEVFREDRLVGGLYGLALGGAFFAESKFSRETDASKVALTHLVARLKAGGFTLLDTQFPNPHLDQFGAMTVTEERFQRLLAQALDRKGDFYRLGRPGAAGGGGTPAGNPGGAPPVSGAGAVPSSAGGGVSGAMVLQVITQTS